MTSTTIRVAATLLAAATFAGTIGEASANNRYTHTPDGYRRHYGARHHGIGPGAAIAGAALGVIGAGVAAATADRYYNGYPSYTYGPGAYGPRYGYDYHPGYGYYGPY